MSTLVKPITLTEQQEAWLRSQVEGGHYVDESEAIRDLIRREQARSAEVEALRQALIEGEQSGPPEAFDFSAFLQRKTAAHG
ncbi:MAG: type II toxin-antitoxin system ParD family antitoxin [Burkholderiales bacterium]|nr:MAG: type II toxin-antitoxin system ParD family antitoxin [Burkholderiales bacterium]